VPTYQYACTDCAERVEVVQKFTDEPLLVCSLCGGRLRKVFSPVGIVFKGSGFYRTDSRAAAKAAATKDKALNGSSENGSGSASSSDSGGSSDAKSGGGSSSGDKKADKSVAASGSGSSAGNSGGSPSPAGSSSSGKSSSSGSKVA
jgi:putative FmdB family regulatory protein